MIKYIITLMRFFLNIIYGLFKIVTHPHKKIIFLSRQSNAPSIDITMLSDKIKQLHPGYEVVILCKKIGDGLSGKIAYCFHMLKQMYHLASCEVVILDSYAILVSLLHHRSSLLVIQMWHSVGTMKKFAYSILDKPEGSSSIIANAMKMHHNYDYILCAGEGYRDHLAEGFNYPTDKIKILPLPRVEVLQSEAYSNSTKEIIYKIHPELKNKKNILYVPTFRKDKEEGDKFIEAVDNLEKAFIPYSKEYNLIIKAHPLSGFDGGYNDFSSFNMLFIADYVISDYSCIIYEAAIRHIPLFFYTYDYESYMSKRDIYIDYKNEIPNEMYNNPIDLLAAIDADQFDMPKQDAFLSKYVEYKRPHITADIVNFIWEHKN